MDSEEKLLIGLIKGSAKKEIYKNINWEKFTKLCYYHRITTFICQKLDKKLVPKKELKKLQETNKKNTLINLILNKEMLSLFKELESKKIDFIAIKGMALNHLLYSESFSRISSDIDVLIKDENYSEIKRMLEKKSYTSSSFGLWKQKPYAQHFPVMAKKVKGIKSRIELHNKLFFPVNSFSVDLNEVWKDSKKINSIFVPSNEDMIIIAVLSAVYQHTFHGIIESIIDVKNILAKEKINFKKLKEKTVKYNAIEPMVYFNELLKESFNIEIQGIKELESTANKKKMQYLKKKSLKEIIRAKSLVPTKLETIKNRFYWTANFSQKAQVFFFLIILSGLWKIKDTLLSRFK